MHSMSGRDTIEHFHKKKKLKLEQRDGLPECNTEQYGPNGECKQVSSILTGVDKARGPSRSFFRGPRASVNVITSTSALRMERVREHNDPPTILQRVLVVGDKHALRHRSFFVDRGGRSTKEDEARERQAEGKEAPSPHKRRWRDKDSRENARRGGAHEVHRRIPPPEAKVACDVQVVCVNHRATNEHDATAREHDLVHDIGTGKVLGRAHASAVVGKNGTRHEHEETIDPCKQSHRELQSLHGFSVQHVRQRLVLLVRLFSMSRLQGEA